MLDLKQFKGFALIHGDNSHEARQLVLYSAMHDVPLKRIPNGKTRCPEDLVPCGSVEWCLYSLGVKVKPDYYPDWLSEYLYRAIWETTEWPLEMVFIKPSDRYKRFTGFVTSGTYKKKRKPPFWCSQVVKFENEWRYYISKGKVLCGSWYSGDEISTPDAPPLNIKIPETYCGAVDFGMLSGWRLALVEANHPFACGWYGGDREIYLQWLIDGWEYMKNN